MTTPHADPASVLPSHFADTVMGLVDIYADSVRDGDPPEFQIRERANIDHFVRQSLARFGTRPAAVVDYPHIKEPYTLEEIEAKIASHDYGAEHLLQHAMLLLRARQAAEPAPLTPEEHQVLRSAVRDSAEVVAPGRMEEPAKTEAEAFDAFAARVRASGKAWVSREVWAEAWKAATPLDLRRASKWGRVYDKASRLMAVLGRDGEVSTRSDEVSLLMDALCDLDGGEHMPGLMPALSTPPTPEAEPAQQDTKWIAWQGNRMTRNGPIPVPVVSLRFRDGVEADNCNPFEYSWRDRNQPDDIVAYRLATPPAEKQTWAPDQVEQVEKEAMEMLGKLQASPQAAPSGEDK